MLLCLKNLACPQQLLRQNGLTDLYLARTASAMVGAQALVLSALEASSASGASGITSDKSSVSSMKAPRSHKAVPVAGSHDKKQLKKAISSRMKRQVGMPGCCHAIHSASFMPTAGDRLLCYCVREGVLCS